MVRYTGRFSAPALRRFARNPASGGRDFIVADIHGQYAELMAQLAAVAFDVRRDRLFSAGDLIDRGPSSIECLELLREPWFHAVLANHETMMLTALRNRPSAYHNPSAWLANGGQWVLALPDEDKARLAALLPLVEQNPLVMTVDHPDGRFNMAHAQLTRPDTGAPFQDADLRNEALLEDAEVLLTWGRTLYSETMRCSMRADVGLGAGEALAVTGAPFERGLSLTYVGHTPVRRCWLHRSHFFMDRGAGLTDGSGQLLVLEHADVMAKLRGAGICD